VNETGKCTVLYVTFFLLLSLMVSSAETILLQQNSIAYFYWYSELCMALKNLGISGHIVSHSELVNIMPVPHQYICFSNYPMCITLVTGNFLSVIRFSTSKLLLHAQFFLSKGQNSAVIYKLHSHILTTKCKHLFWKTQQWHVYNSTTNVHI